MKRVAEVKHPLYDVKVKVGDWGRLRIRTGKERWEGPMEVKTILCSCNQVFVSPYKDGKERYHIENFHPIDNL